LGPREGVIDNRGFFRKCFFSGNIPTPYSFGRQRPGWLGVDCLAKAYCTELDLLLAPTAIDLSLLEFLRDLKIPK